MSDSRHKIRSGPAALHRRALLVMGTRPEVIKLAPLVRALETGQRAFRPVICATGQHLALADDALHFFRLRPDYALGVMQAGQRTESVLARCLEQLGQTLAECRPDCVIAQGDTTTALAASLAAFYHRIPFVHVEAGLRTWDLAAPWPEEFHRRGIAISASLHCAPTARAFGNLIREGVPRSCIRITGNTVVDAVQSVMAELKDRPALYADTFGPWLDRPLAVITLHRRENQGDVLGRICAALRRVASTFPQVQFVLPVHPNPQVQGPILERLSGLANVSVLPPVGYGAMLFLLNRALVIITDSGGIQEEAAVLGRRILVVRDKTERPEAVTAGVARVIGTRATPVQSACEEELARLLAGEPQPAPSDAFGDGTAAEQIWSWVEEAIPVSKTDAA